MFHVKHHVSREQKSFVSQTNEIQNKACKNKNNHVLLKDVEWLFSHLDLQEIYSVGSNAYQFQIGNYDDTPIPYWKA